MIYNLHDDEMRHTLSFLPGGFAFAARMVCSRWAKLLSAGKTQSRLECYVCSVPLVLWASDNGCSLRGHERNLAGQLLIALAARHGHIPVLEWARQIGNCFENGHASLEAAMNGQIHVLDWLYDSDGPLHFALTWSAARAGQIASLEWLQEHDIHCHCDDVDVCYTAAEQGHLHVLKWLKDNGWPCCEAKVSASCAMNGQLECLQWLWDHGCRCDHKVCELAAEHGHLEVLEWALHNGLPYMDNLCTRAAIWGELRVLMWLRERGHPWDEDTFEKAIHSGNLPLLQWLKDNGCPWDVSECVGMARRMNHRDVLRWIKDVLV